MFWSDTRDVFFGWLTDKGVYRYLTKSRLQEFSALKNSVLSSIHSHCVPHCVHHTYANFPGTNGCPALNPPQTAHACPFT